MSDDNKIRLQLFLARCGVASRRKCATLIEKGNVRVNGAVIKEPFYKIDPAKDRVEFDSKEIKLSKYIFYKLYKPKGILSAMSDDRGRKTISNLIPSKYGSLFFVGRLDLDSEGLMILTNHGEAANRITHPRYHVSKVYKVMLDKEPNVGDLLIMSKGIELEGKKTIPAFYERIGAKGSKQVRVEIMEGRKRQIKLVFREFGYKVQQLKRVSIGPIRLGDMKPGEISEFSLDELLSLFDAIGMGTLV
jgi:23S rRNA pseudouridine2605 synthase